MSVISRIANFACTYPAAAANYALGAATIGVAAKYALMGRPGDALAFGILGAGVASLGYCARRLQDAGRLHLDATVLTTTFSYHLLEELFLYQTPGHALFRHVTGMDPPRYAEAHLPEYVALVWGIPLAAGVATAVVHRSRVRRRERDSVMLRIVQRLQNEGSDATELNEPITPPELPRSSAGAP